MSQALNQPPRNNLLVLQSRYKIVYSSILYLTKHLEKKNRNISYKNKNTEKGSIVNFTYKKKIRLLFLYI